MGGLLCLFHLADDLGCVTRIILGVAFDGEHDSCRCRVVICKGCIRSSFLVGFFST